MSLIHRDLVDESLDAPERAASQRPRLIIREKPPSRRQIAAKTLKVAEVVNLHNQQIDALWAELEALKAVKTLTFRARIRILFTGA